MATTESSTAAGTVGEYYLKKRHPGCTGMFWRPDPTPGAKKLASNNDWPRDGAMVRGVTVTDQKSGAPWLLVSHVKQAGSDWVAAPVSAALPFEYDNHYYLEK